MKILMRNIGMTLHVIHTLRRQGIDNVKVNMDWQHLIMNGENLAEYAALLAAEGLLGHQHANSGWGTFDDDNMVGATAFMETLELAVELRRAGYGTNGERLGFDLYPYTEDAVGAVKRSVLQWRFIDGVAARIDEADLRAAQQEKDAVRAYELVYAALGADPRRPRRRHVRRQGDRDLGGRRRARDRGGALPALDAAAGLGRAGPGGLVARRAGVPRAAARGRVGFAGQMHGLVALDDADRVLRPAILWNDQRTGAECAEIEARVGLERLIELTGNRALTGFTAPKLLWLRAHEPDTVRADPPCAAAEGLRAPPPDRRARDRRRGRLGDAALRRRRAAAGPTRSARRSRSRSSGCRRCTSRRRSRGAGDQAAAALGVGIDAPGPVSVVLGTSGVVFAVLPAYAPDPQARVHVFCHAVPATWHAMGVMLSAAGSAALAARRARRRPRQRSTRRRSAGRRERGAALRRRTSPASARRTPTRTRAARSPASRCATIAARSGARCSRASPSVCATRWSSSATSARARRRARLRRRRPQPALGADRRVRARPPARADRVRGRLGLRRGDARRRARRSVRRRARRGRAVRSGPRASRARPGLGRGLRRLRALRALYPR